MWRNINIDTKNRTTSDFDEKKRQCKQCRNIAKFKENFDDIVESEFKKLISLNKYDRLDR